jgi:biotin operon repressor
MDTSKGFVKFWRSMEDWEWYKDTNTFRVFFHLILKVNYKEKRWQGISVMPGQIITSAEGLAEDLHLSRQNVRTALEHLKSTGEITIKTTNKFSLITVANWASYQDNDTQPTSKSTSKITIDQPSTNHQLTTTKEVKKERRKEDSIANKKMKHGTFENVLLTEEELGKIMGKFPQDWKIKIDRLSEYMESKGAKYSSHYATILSWDRREEKDNPPKQSSMPVY